MTTQHTYAKLYMATDGATAGQLQLPQAIIPFENTQPEDDPPSQSVVPTNKSTQRQARRAYSRYLSYALGVTFALSIAVGLGLTPQDVHATEMSTLATEVAAKIEAFVPDAIKGVIAIGGVSFAIIFVVGVVKIIRAVL